MTHPLRYSLTITGPGDKAVTVEMNGPLSREAARRLVEFVNRLEVDEAPPFDPFIPLMVVCSTCSAGPMPNFEGRKVPPFTCPKCQTLVALTPPSTPGNAT